MVLLHCLQSLASKNRWKILVAHFNHQLRGRASDDDAKLVRTVAKKLRLPFFVESAEVEKFAAQSKISIEMAARKLRHEFLARTARGQKVSTIAVAHHADDQVELFFLRLLRGTGGSGLAGMKRSSPSPADDQIMLVRPLLGFFKAEILAYAREHGILFREDASNLSNHFLRNRIRNQLLPLLKKHYQPGVARNILRLMDIAGAESELVAAVAREWRKDACGKLAPRKIRTSTPSEAWSGRDFADLSPAIQRKILQQELLEMGVAPDFDLVERLRTSTGKWVSLGSDFSLSRDNSGKLSLRRSVPTEFNPAELKFKCPGRAGRVEFGGKTFHWHTEKQDQPLPPRLPARQLGVEMFDAERIGGEIILRHWRAGDRFQPIGLASPVKLQDLFVNAKIPAARRRDLIMATTPAGEIFWVEGMRIGERFKLTSETRRKFTWKLVSF
jgi:tRNA(Ile)-lysidine synthase